MSKRNHLVIIAVIAIVGAFSYSVYKDLKSVTDISVETPTPGLIGNSGTMVGVGSSTGSGYTLEQVPIASIPDLNRVVIATKDIDAATRKIMEDNLKMTQELLKKDPNKSELWFTLASHRKVAEDYVGARISWQYLTERYPTDYLAFANLGNLYAYYLPNILLAEQSYLKAIQLAPQQTYLYFQITDFYRDVAKTPTKAQLVVQKGVAANPNNVELKKLAESLK